MTTTVYLLNRSPTRSMIGKMLYEAWHKRKLNVHHLRIFGCVAHVKTVNPHISKLAGCNTLVVFIGYEIGSKAYRVHNQEASGVSGCGVPRRKTMGLDNGVGR